MSIASLRFLEHVHGHVAWLAALALVHPAVLLRNPRRRAMLAALAATTLVTLAALMGATMYPAYRTRIKPMLFAEAPALGWAFERKEHLGTAAVLLAWVGFAAHWASRSTGPRDTATLARTAHGAYVGAALCALVTGALGIAIACQRGFE